MACVKAPRIIDRPLRAVLGYN